MPNLVGYDFEGGDAEIFVALVVSKSRNNWLERPVNSGEYICDLLTILHEVAQRHSCAVSGQMIDVLLGRVEIVGGSEAR